MVHQDPLAVLGPLMLLVLPVLWVLVVWWHACALTEPR